MTADGSPPVSPSPETTNEWEWRDSLASRVFRPATPVNEDGLFAGRREQLRQVIDAVNQPGQHAIIFGERGVGKTSLANILTSRLGVTGGTFLAPRINCDTGDDYSRLWKKVFSEIQLIRQKKAIGFEGGTSAKGTPLTEGLPETVTSEDVRKRLTLISSPTTVVMVILDELDRLNMPATGLLADTIKTLSDHSVGATLVLVGVADTVDTLIAEHRSVERALVQVQMPRMSRSELDEIVTRGLSRLKMDIEPKALARISLLSQGLPHYTHLLALHAVRAAIDATVTVLTLDHVEAAIRKSLEKAQQSIRNGYRHAVTSNKKDNLFTQVLLACALAHTDEFGYFAAADVRDPFRQITGKNYDIPSFARHLNEFTDDSRGQILQKSGASRRYRFRFRNPLMQPYVTMQGFASGLLNRALMQLSGWA